MSSEDGKHAVFHPQSLSLNLDDSQCKRNLLIRARIKLLRYQFVQLLLKHKAGIVNAHGNVEERSVTHHYVTVKVQMKCFFCCRT